MRTKLSAPQSWFVDPRGRNRYGWLLYIAVAAVGGGLAIFAETRPSSDLKSTLLAMAASIWSVCLVFGLVERLFLWRPYDYVIDEVDKLSGIVQSAAAEIRFYPDRKVQYDAAIRAIETSQWERIRIFAPVGFWQKDDDKERWLEKLAASGNRAIPNPEHLDFVFGLPPINIEDAKKAVDHVEEMITMLKRPKANFRFYPPMPASVAFGAIVFEAPQDSESVALFGLACDENEYVVDYSFALKNRQIAKKTITWFDKRIWDQAQKLECSDRGWRLLRDYYKIS